MRDNLVFSGILEQAKEDLTFPFTEFTAWEGGDLKATDQDLLCLNLNRSSRRSR